MFIRSLTHPELQEILERDELILKHQPTCPSCGSSQIQIKFKQKPARWKCRMCMTWFTSEPEKIS